MTGKWLASGEQNEAFEKEFAEYVGVDYAVCVNSGSSANFLALAALNLPAGSKVITSACGFPATFSPLLHLGLEPVLVDDNMTTHNIDVEQVYYAIRESRAEAMLFAHTLGVPVDMVEFTGVAASHGVKIIEDCCEALGAKYPGEQVGATTTAGTYSFYPSHQITALGGGGMVVTNDKDVFKKLRSLRDWGKMSNWDKYE